MLFGIGTSERISPISRNQKEISFLSCDIQMYEIFLEPQSPGPDFEGENQQE